MSFEGIHKLKPQRKNLVFYCDLCLLKVEEKMRASLPYQDLCLECAQKFIIEKSKCQ